MYKALFFLIMSLGFMTQATQPVKKLDTSEWMKKEAKLRNALSEIRLAIYSYKYDCECGKIGALDRVANDECYPGNLEYLVQGIAIPNSKEIKIYLKAIPVDPMTGKSEWGHKPPFRTVSPDPEDQPGSIAQVYSLSEETAINRTKYSDW